MQLTASLMIKPGSLDTILNKYLHYIYLLYAAVIICTTVIITPPFQNPDEPYHFARAEQVSRLELIPTFVFAKHNDSIAGIPKLFYPDKDGFKADKGIFSAYNYFHHISFNPSVKTNTAKQDSAKKINWGNGMAYVNFGNTAINPPVTYLMPAIGIAIGKLFYQPVITTLYISRYLNAVLCLALCFTALLLAKRSKLLMFIVLLFPMTIALFSAVSPDAVLISCAFLLVAVIDNVEFGETKLYNKQHIYGLVIFMCIIGLAKPPYIILAIVFLFLTLNNRTKLIMITIPVLVVISWLMINHANYSIKFAPAEYKVNAKMQIANIIHHPFKFAGMFFNIDMNAIYSIARMFVGVLGWLDVQFSNLYYEIAYGLLIAGIIISSKFDKKANLLLKTSFFVAAIFTTLAVITAQYVTWTAVGANELSGMQGRYLLPIFPFVALGLSGQPIGAKFIKLKNTVLILVLLFPVYTFINLIYTLTARYY